jgi:hypothetical protein
MGFPVKNKQCKTCIYIPASGFDVEALENQVRDHYVGFSGYRVCHEGNNACCRVFWNRHRDEFSAGQLAQRLNLVAYVE